VKVTGALLEHQLVELLPAPLSILGDHAADSERPRGRVDIGGRAGRQDREAGLVVLARPKPVATAAPAPGEASRDEVGHHSSANRWWMSRTAIEPSPNAETTRLTEPE